jgi:hypothetical protein
MKKSVLIIILSVSVIISTALWLNYSNASDTLNIVHYVVIFVLVAFASIMAFGKIKSKRQGLPEEDELSSQLKEKAAAKSYYFSIYLWLLLMYLSNEKNIDPEKSFGYGILGMAVLFGVLWTFYKIKGLKND